MNKTNIFFIVFLIAVLLIIVFAILSMDKDIVSGEESQEEDLDVQSCDSDMDCSDKNECTIDVCNSNVCSFVGVKLCYQKDGCGPSGCNPNNDNDCRSEDLS